MAQERDIPTTTTVPLEPGRENIPRKPDTEPGRAQEVKSEIKSEGHKVAEQAKDKGKGYLSEQKGNTAHLLKDLAGAVRNSANYLEEQSHPTSSRYFRRTADSLESFSNTLRERDLDALFSQIRESARRQPGLWVAGSVLAGFFMSRLLKSPSGASGAEERIETQPVEPTSSEPVLTQH